MGKWPFTQFHDDVLDKVYFGAFLTAPARLTVTVGGNRGVRHAHRRHPWQRRHGRGRSADSRSIEAARIFSTSSAADRSSARKPRRTALTWGSCCQAGSGGHGRGRPRHAAGSWDGRTDERHVVEGEGRPIPTRAGAAVTLPVKGLKTGMYNLRFTSNPNAYDRRLTLFADGVERADPGERYRIPLWLPPTGEGKWATATLMWTLYDATTYLNIACSRKPDPAPGEKINVNEPDRKPGWNDTADVLIGTVDLVRSESSPSFAAPAAPAFPELVKIPGGATSQWAAKRSTKADELPAARGEAFGFCHRQIRCDQRPVRAFLAGTPPVARRLFLARPRAGHLRGLVRCSPLLQLVVQEGRPVGGV